MKRKEFLGAAGALLAGATIPFKPALAAEKPLEETAAFKIPPYLKPGDTIGITSPAGFTTLEKMQPAIQQMESWGYKIKIGTTIDQRDFTFGGTDEQRLVDLQQMLDDPTINAIMCARGGYGAVRIVDRLDWRKFKKHPKWVIGFSDITVLHNHIHTNCKAASVHSKMTNSFPDDWNKAEPIQIETINSIRDAIAGVKMKYSAIPNLQNRLGSVDGVLIGGNLRTIETLAGSCSDINTANKILFVEDTGEYLYSIDRMFWNLKRTGKLDKLKGLIVGGFNVKKDDEGDEFGRTVQDIVLEKIKDCSYPVCFDFPVGHQRANFALKCGVKHRLTVSANEVTLVQI